jgi:methylmalonyl-CoA mutase C-terminal domain/subunit
MAEADECLRGLMSVKKISVLMAKPGLDGHWRGMIVVTRALRDAGMEVIYGGNMSPEEIAVTAVQEDVDVVGLSILVDTYMPLVKATSEALNREGKGDVLLLVGGIIFEEDIPALEQMGVARVFGPGERVEDIVEFVINRL